MVERVLANLVSNAVRHNSEDVTVTLGAESGEDGVVLSCADTGHGIPDAVKDKLFDEFTSSSRDEGSTPSYGLGLAFCRAAVEAHGGKIWFETESGKGTTFSFTIPNQQPAVCIGKKKGESND
jgi:signal transduction histidine kinase